MPDGTSILGHRREGGDVSSSFSELYFVDRHGGDLLDLPTFVVTGGGAGDPAFREVSATDILALRDPATRRCVLVRGTGDPPGTDDPGEHLQPQCDPAVIDRIASVANGDLALADIAPLLKRLPWHEDDVLCDGKADLFATDDEGALEEPGTDDHGEEATDDWGEEE